MTDKKSTILNRLLGTPLYAWLLPAIPVAQLFLLSAHRFTVSLFFICVIATVALFNLLRIAARFVIRDNQKADAVLALGFFCLFLYDFIFESSGYIWFWLVGFLCLGSYVMFKSDVAARMKPVLNVLAVVIIAPTLVQIATQEDLAKRNELREVTNQAFAALPETNAKTADQRDIYYLVFDRYARADQLLQVHGFDNRPFLDELAKRGFSINDKAFANYQRTAHSLASTLNLDYLDTIDAEATRDSRDWVPIYELIQDFRLRRFLADRGYRFEFFGTWWEPTRRNAVADQNHNHRSWPLMLTTMFDNSLLGKAVRWAELPSLNSRSFQCEREKHKFDRLKSAPGDGAPKFMFAHFLVPHPPYVFDADGKCMSASQVSKRTRAENYIAQVKYTNREILKVIDNLLNRSGPKPIIILQADEGPWPEKFAGDEINLLGGDVTAVDWREATTVDLREKMAILSATYLPGIEAEQAVNNASPVNTFRKVLREYFAAPLPPLPDRYYAYESNDNLYHFIDVTDKLASSN